MVQASNALKKIVERQVNKQQKNSHMKILNCFLAVMLLSAFAANGQTIQGNSNPVLVDVAPAASLAANATAPVIIWIEPNLPSTAIQVKKLIIKVGINSTVKMRNVTLLINGNPPDEQRGFGTTSADATKFSAFVEKEVELNNGPNEIKLIAENEIGQQTIEVRTVNVAAAIASNFAPRKDYALLFATNDYNEHDALKNPVFDATAIANELKNYYGFEVELVLNPTKSIFLKKLREYSLRNYLPEDQLFIFIAGHGKFDEVGKDGYIVTKDSKRDDDIYDTYISYSTIRTQVDNNPCKHIFLTIDACFGGTFDQALAKRGDDGDAAYSMIAQSDYIMRKLQYKTRIYLTSGGKKYVSDGREGKHSPFAAKFIEVLRNYGGKMRVVTTQQILANVETGKEVPRYGGFGDNEPGSEFVFVAK